MKRVIIITAEAFEDEEVIYPVLRLREEGIEVTLATPGAKLVVGRVSYPLERLVKYFAPLVDTASLDPDKFEAVIVPGGFEAPDRLRMDGPTIEFVRAMDAAGKLVASICHGPRVLISAGVLHGRAATGHVSVAEDIRNSGADYRDEPVVADGHVITAQHPRDTGAFMRAVIGYLNER